MDAIDLIQRLHAHRRWANTKLCESAATLTPAQRDQSFTMGRGSLWATLVHLYGAERVWLQTLNGDESPALIEPDAFESLDELRRAWEANERAFAQFLDVLTVEQLDRPLRKRATETGAVHETPMYDALLHVCTHAQYTTAQAVNMLRQLGADVPDTQLITMSRSGT